MDNVTTATKNSVLVILKSTLVMLFLASVNKHSFFQKKPSSTLHLKKGKLHDLQKFIGYFSGITFSTFYDGAGDYCSCSGQLRSPGFPGEIVEVLMVLLLLF